MQNNMYTNRFTFALFCKNHHVYSKIYNLVFCVFCEYLCNFVSQFKNMYPRFVFALVNVFMSREMLR